MICVYTSLFAVETYRHHLIKSSSRFLKGLLTSYTFIFIMTVSEFGVNMDFSPRGSSKRVSSSTRWRVGSLVPLISLSVMMT